jgi:hypothetical protein
LIEVELRGLNREVPMNEAINPARKMKSPSGKSPKHTVMDLAEATDKSPHDVRRILRRLGEPKNYTSERGATYGWDDFSFETIARRVRHWPASSMPNFDDNAA